MLTPIWEGRCSKYELFNQVTYCGVFTYLWWRVQERAEGNNGEKESKERIKHKEKGKEKCKVEERGNSLEK